MKCVKPTDKIILHSKNLNIENDKVFVSQLNYQFKTEDLNPGRNCRQNCDDDSRTIKITNKYYVDEHEMYVIEMAENLQSNAYYSLSITYNGELTQGLAGYYRSSYKDLKTGETK